ncbi:hypothetical protein GCM10023336_19640 [Streptomyces similanensis]|uniref:Uncharacterized protein n=1 Tax=Streptomyces similanensis TaxID=1274988 RepID=A0ABP9K6V8_9ACTN
MRGQADPVGAGMLHRVREQFADQQGGGVQHLVVQFRVPVPYPVHRLVPRDGDRVRCGRYGQSEPVYCHE